jgi:hypothetical protein
MHRKMNFTLPIHPQNAQPPITVKPMVRKLIMDQRNIPAPMSS